MRGLDVASIASPPRIQPHSLCPFGVEVHVINLSFWTRWSPQTPGITGALRRGARRAGLDRWAALWWEWGWKDALGLSINCLDIPRRPDEPDCGWEVLRPRCRRRQGVIIYPHKVLRGCYFFINNFLWAQRCPQPRHHLISLSRPLRDSAAASKPGLFFACGGTRQLAPASCLFCPVSQRRAGSAAPFCQPGP